MPADPQKPLFAPPAAGGQRETSKLLIVDDERDVHRVTRLVLSDLDFSGTRVDLLHAYSGAEAIERLRENPDTAVMLLDIVMESENAGWEVVRRTRDELKNADVQIIIRTGYPGTLPEQKLIRRYDIHDYRDKGELTRDRMYVAISSALHAHRNQRALHAARDALRLIPLDQITGPDSALDQVAGTRLEEFARTVHLQHALILVERPGAGPARGDCGTNPVIGAIGEFAGLDRDKPRWGLEPDLHAFLLPAFSADMDSPDSATGRLLSLRSRSGLRVVIYHRPAGNPDSPGGQSPRWFAESLATALEMNSVVSTIGAALRDLSQRIDQVMKRD